MRWYFPSATRSYNLIVFEPQLHDPGLQKHETCHKSLVTHRHFLDDFQTSSVLLRRRAELTIRELMDEQRERVRSGDPAERFAAALIIPSELSRRLRLLSDSQIGRLLDEEVCGKMSILAPEATVCVEATRRLKRASPTTRPFRALMAEQKPGTSKS